MLNFLNPTVLFALAAASIPLLIHLFNRRKIKRISFSTIHFLKRLEKKQMRNLRIRQLILLILRTLIIIFLVMAFAKPTIKSGSGGLLTERTPIEAVIILDNSLSLNEVHLAGTLQKNLREAFDKLQTIFKAGDRITILQSTIPQKELVSQENYQSNLWERVERKLQPNYLKSSLYGSLIFAIEHLKQSHFYNREIYILSDFQKSALNTKDIGQLNDETKNNNIRLFFLPIKHSNSENISVDSVEVINRLIEKNQVLKISTLLNNHDKAKHLNTMESVLLNNKRVAQKNVTLENNKIAQNQFQLTLTENGFIEGEIQIESDALNEDNRRFFNFHIPEKIKILHFVPRADFDSYLPLIISPAENRGIFDYTKSISLKWSDFNFKDYDIILLEGLRELPSNLAQRLTNFALQGGGILIIPGPDIVIPQYQKMMQDLEIGSILELNGTPGKTEQFLTISKIEWDNTIFEGLFETQQKQFNPIEVYAYYKIKPAPQTETLIQLSEGSPFLALKTIKQGSAAFISSVLNTKWSELPLKGFVIPLMYRLIYYMGSRKVLDRQSILCGESYQQLFTDLEPPYNFKLIGPNETEIKLTPNFKGTDVLLKVENVEEPGNYRITHNDQTLTVFSVNPWKVESQMDFFSNDELEKLIPNTHVINDYNKASEIILQSRFGKELWKHFLFFAIILLLIEMIVARTSSKKDFKKTTMEESLAK